MKIMAKERADFVNDNDEDIWIYIKLLRIMGHYFRKKMLSEENLSKFLHAKHFVSYFTYILYILWYTQNHISVDLYINIRVCQIGIKIQHVTMRY
jgi:hypothetical protein